MNGSIPRGRFRPVVRPWEVWIASLASLVMATGAGACKSAERGKERPPGGHAAAPEETPGPERGGHIKLPSNEPRYTDPILETRFDLGAGLVFEGLVGVDAKLDPVKRLAEAWTISDDGKV